MYRGLLSVILVVCILQTVAAVHNLKLRVKSKDQKKHIIFFGEGEFKEAGALPALNSDHACVIPHAIFLKKIGEENLSQDILTEGVWLSMSITNSYGNFGFDIVDKPHIGYRRPRETPKKNLPTDFAEFTENEQQWIAGSQETEDKVVVIGGDEQD